MEKILLYVTSKKRKVPIYPNYFEFSPPQIVTIDIFGSNTWMHKNVGNEGFEFIDGNLNNCKVFVIFQFKQLS